MFVSLYVADDFHRVAKQDFLVKEDMLLYDNNSNALVCYCCMVSLYKPYIMVLIVRHTKIIRALIFFSSNIAGKVISVLLKL